MCFNTPVSSSNLWYDFCAFPLAYLLSPSCSIRRSTHANCLSAISLLSHRHRRHYRSKSRGKNYGTQIRLSNKLRRASEGERPRRPEESTDLNTVDSGRDFHELRIFLPHSLCEQRLLFLRLFSAVCLCICRLALSRPTASSVITTDAVSSHAGAPAGPSLRCGA